MNRRPDNKLIIAAIEQLENEAGREGSIVIAQNGKKTIESKYRGYIASFGGSVINSGLLGTVMIFEANSEKQKIISLLSKIYNERFGEEPLPDRDVYMHISEKNNDKKYIKKLRNRLINVATALKLAMRTFEKAENIQ